MANYRPSSNPWSTALPESQEPPDDWTPIVQSYDDMQNHRPPSNTRCPSSNPWSTALPESEEPQNHEVEIGQTLGLATLPPSDGYDNRRRNHDRLYVPVENDPLPNKKRLSSIASRLYVDQPKAPLQSVGPGSEDRLRTLWMQTATPEIDFGMRCCSFINPDMDGLQSEQVYSPCPTYAIYIPKKKFVQILNIRQNHWIVASNVFNPFRDLNTVVIYDCAYGIYKHEQFEQISWLLRPTCNRMKVIFSPVQQQTPETNLCGHYAISYSKAICQDIEPERIVINEGTLREDVTDWLEACYCGETIDQEFEQLMESPSQLQQDDIIIDLCHICKLACDEWCCICLKHSHQQCQWFDNVRGLKFLGCKLCGV